jgi:hypothetical protein
VASLVIEMQKMQSGMAIPVVPREPGKEPRPKRRARLPSLKEKR